VVADLDLIEIVDGSLIANAHIPTKVFESERFKLIPGKKSHSVSSLQRGARSESPQRSSWASVGPSDRSIIAGLRVTNGGRWDGPKYSLLGSAYYSG
jgi:hypothetical protein